MNDEAELILEMYFCYVKHLIFIFIIFTAGQTFAFEKDNSPKNNKLIKPKHIILIIGDGTGLAQWFAYQSQLQAREHRDATVFKEFPIVGFSQTNSSNNFITDSGAGASAFSIGKKTNNYMIGMSPDSISYPTLSEIAHGLGKSTGIAVTCELTHATPAAFFAHQDSREKMREIAQDFEKSACIDVAIGGGYKYFDTTALKKKGYQLGFGWNALNILKGKRIIFYDTADAPPQANKGRNLLGPLLSSAAIQLIKTMYLNPKGSFTMIEGSQIDWAGHKRDSAYLMAELSDLDQCIAQVIQMAKLNKNTLVIVTGDHETGGLSVVDWDKANNSPVINFSTGNHTAIPVPVFAVGPGSELFQGSYPNNAIFDKILLLMKD